MDGRTDRRTGANLLRLSRDSHIINDIEVHEQPVAGSSELDVTSTNGAETLAD